MKWITDLQIVLISTVKWRSQRKRKRYNAASAMEEITVNKQEFQKYILDIYGVVPDFPWESNPTFAVYRHQSNRKWFALVMNIPKSKLGLHDDGMIDVVNLKCDPVLTGSLRLENGIFPAYHMSKDKWISVALDGSVDDGKIKMLLDMSYELNSLKLTKRKKTV